jgi:hypothetical protein
VVNGVATAVWEIVNASPFSLDALTFGVYESFVANPGLNSPAPGTATVSMGFAPAPPAFSAVEASQASSTLPLPRFVDPATVPLNLFSINACLGTKYTLTTNVSPAGAGMVTPGGSMDAGGTLSIAAIAKPGYQFAGFSGDLSGVANPQNLTMNGPKNVVANFAALAPNVSASITGRTGTLGARQWNVTLTNSGLGAANNLQISGLTLVQTAGAVCTPVVNGPLPADVGTLAPNASGTAVVGLSFTGCAPTARYRVTISFHDKSGPYAGSTTLNNLFY